MGRVVWAGGSIFLRSGEFGEVIEHFKTLETNRGQNIFKVYFTKMGRKSVYIVQAGNILI